jgi:hypothetical protein
MKMKMTVYLPISSTLPLIVISFSFLSLIFHLLRSLESFKASVNVRKGTVQINGHWYQPGDQMLIKTSKGLSYCGAIQQITSTEVWLKTPTTAKKRLYLSHVRKGKLVVSPIAAALKV